MIWKTVRSWIVTRVMRRGTSSFVYTPHALNWSLFVIGMAVVWGTSASWWSLVGAFVASIHVRVGFRTRW